MKITRCDMCGKDIFPAFAFNISLSTNEAWIFSDERSDEFDLCEACYKKIKDKIQEMIEEENK